MKRVKVTMSFNATAVFKDPDVAKTLSPINNKYVVVPSDKAHNNIVFVCKTYYIQCLLSEVDKDNNSSNKTYTAHPLSLKKRK